MAAANSTAPTAYRMNTDDFTAQYHRINAMDDGPRRRRAIENFHRDAMALYLRIAGSFCRRSGAAGSEVDDYAQEVAMVAQDLLVNFPLRQGYVFEQVLRRESFSKLRGESMKGSMTGIGGTSGKVQRHRRMMEAEARLYSTLEREPTPDEVVAEAQRVIEETYRTPSKFGAMDVSDLVSPRPIYYADVTEAGDESEIVLPGQGELELQELEAFIQDVIALAYERHPDIGGLADYYLRPCFDLELPTVFAWSKMSAETGRSVAWCRRNVTIIKEIAAEMIEDRLGIASDGTDVELD